jgi:putative tricarboxylic transport membrane protein
MEASTLDGLMLGLQSVMSPEILLYCFVGVFLGTFVGVLPGIGSIATISLLLPITYHLPPVGAIIMLAGVYYGAQYGGSTSSILLNVPGHAAAVVACLDGNPMARQGRAGVALFMTTIASFIGAMLGLAALVLFTPAIASVGMRFGPAEYFSIMVLGLIAASTLASGAPAKGLAMVVLGLLLGTVGADINSGTVRFSFGLPELMDGINLVALAMGLFGISKLISSLGAEGATSVTGKIPLRSMIPTRQDMRDSVLPMLRGTGIGGFFGALPGAGASISAFMAYAAEKRISRRPERFGNGAIEGLTAPEAANNASAQTAFVPTLSLGIPGDAVMALMLGALMIHGIQPGPMLISDQPVLFWTLIASFAIGNIMLMILNIPLISLWVSVLRIPYNLLYPAILVFICLGTYSVNSNWFDVVLVGIIGAVGYLMKVLDFEPAPLLLGFVLGPLMEENLRRALLLSHGDLTVFLSRPISMWLLIASAGILMWSVSAPILRWLRRYRVAARSRADRGREPPA